MHRMSTRFAGSTATKALSAICGGTANWSLWSGRINFADVAVGRLDVADAEQAQLLRQSPLERAKHALAAAARLRRIGRDMLNAEPCQRPADLGQPLFVHRLAGRRGEEVMTATVGVEA